MIDNASADGSIAYLQPQFLWVKFIQNEQNEGFAKANNKALQMASGKFILFLNPDTLLAEDTLSLCITFYKNNVGAGAIGVRMLDGSGNFLPESKRSFPSPAVSFYKLTGLSSLFPFSKQFGRYALGYLQENAVHEVDVVSGAFMMIPKQILTLTGGFDEQFFMYAEDIDLSYRTQKSGYKNFYLGNVNIIHFKGESTKKGNLNYVRMFYRAMSLFVKKYYQGSGAHLVRLGLQWGIALRGFVSAIYLPFKNKKVKQQAELTKIRLIGNAEQTSLAADIISSYYRGKTVEESANTDEKILPDIKTMIVFCTGDLSYKRSIEILQQQKATSYKWFGKGSTSVVGSDSRDSSGEALALQ